MHSAGVLIYRPTQAAPLPTEPFGQAGVRQYAGRLLVWVFLTIGLCSLAMGHRSRGYYDLLKWYGQSEELHVLSSNGDLLLTHGFYPDRKLNRTGWDYSGGIARGGGPRAGAPESFSVLGVRGAGVPLMRNADSGSYVRVPWVILATVFMIQPVVWVGRRMVRRTRGA